MTHLKSSSSRAPLSNRYLDYAFYRFLPLLLELNSRRLIDYSESCNKRSLAFLSREGFILKAAFDHWVSLRPSSQILRTDYLYVSRRALNRYLIGDKNYDLKYVTHELYEGTVLDFFKGRFGLEQSEAEGLFSAEDLRSKISWGERDKMLFFAGTLNSRLLKDPLPDKELLTRYLVNLISEDSILVDVGFKGTMQELINFSLPHIVHGFYFAISPEAWSRKFQGSAVERSKSNELIRNSILLESLLTAPHGTTLKYVEVENRIVPKLENLMEDEMPYSLERVLFEMQNYINFSDGEIEEMFWVAWAQSLRGIGQLSKSDRGVFRIEDKWSGVGYTAYEQI